MIPPSHRNYNTLNPGEMTYAHEIKKLPLLYELDEYKSDEEDSEYILAPENEETMVDEIDEFWFEEFFQESQESGKFPSDYHDVCDFICGRGKYEKK